MHCGWSVPAPHMSTGSKSAPLLASPWSPSATTPWRGGMPLYPRFRETHSHAVLYRSAACTKLAIAKGFPSSVLWFFLSDICAFCHKAILPQAPTVEAMNKQYHADCFTCRTCHCQLVGQRYYQKEGRPMCGACYQNTLEKCAKCQAVILEHIVRAIGNGYHPECFTCTVCHRTIGDESFALDDHNKVHCVDDFYRKYASVCSACEKPIIPKEGRDAYKIECLGRNFHENCYRCESCRIPLSTEPTENGCYPLNSHLFCKACHIRQKTESSC
uniref:Filamin binding LIM protein 1 n=1 Tax=Sphenodon punctatus TaxID=8508 RepID=A0A8D0G639_SPHPU